ncbi:DctP family TRAP transporter solute-binding subunit [Glaciimonas sp. PCH181]|uniref:DctP family TRAP transporter solute-binding subunit n=1 Tax=Glaciimonas sp. PCH181 TaxID=2133943 RepID=UPI000D362E79|nr:DctP family TRAP transporter solute-binding subunit [Glaciimonas sp. PCH181]PUA20435.1 ABC transporter substrate-binding protein [Glaciimonas sp. PCH181]
MLETIFKCAADMARHVSCRTFIEPLARLVLPLLGVVVMGTGTTAAAQSPVRQLDIADYRGYLAEDHPVRQGMRKFAQLVDAGSAGNLHVNLRAGALPGTPAKQIAALQAGKTGAPALMLVASTGLSVVAKEFELLDLPFLVRDEQQADALLDGAFGNALLARMAPTGLVGLAWWENGFRQITTSSGPIRRAEDLHGLNFRVIGEPVFVDTARVMGTNPVPLPFNELYEALKSRRVDAQDNFTSQILAGRLYEVQSSLSLTNHSYSPLVLVANAAFWKSLSTAQQRVLQTAAIEAGHFQRQVVRYEARAALVALAQHGLAINQLDESELKKLNDLTESVREQYFGRYKGDLRQLYQAEIGRVQ